MKSAAARYLLTVLSLLAALYLPGCASQKKSVIVLLPEGGKVSGAVTVTTADGSQLLNQSWQSVEIAGSRGGLSQPVVMEAAAVQGIFGSVQAAMPAAPVHYLLYFKMGSAELLPESRLLLPEISAVIKKRSPVQLAVVGHADTVGSIAYNHRLGMQRAAAVIESIRELLVSQEGAPARVETSSRGKCEPLVPTPDQTPEPRNRRVEVTIR
jgi:outer membrane protein OmpA-like peptidoglycan-associated protein